MGGAQVMLAVNISVAVIFACGYAIIALTNRGQQAALWFSAGYFVGMISPVADFLVPFVGAPEVLEWLGYSSFLLATLSISVTFANFHRTSPPWIAIVVILVGGMITRAAIWDMPRDTLAYGMAYQMPFMLSSLLAVWSVLRVAGRRPLHFLLAAIYGIIALHFLAKPYIAMTFGTGKSLADYTRTTYALLSQSSTGILLLASGVVLLLIVAQKAIADSLLVSETDPLSGLANRRGFEQHGKQAVARAEVQCAPAALAMFDLDHFKAVNDTFGHEIGDQVIADFAALLRDVAPSPALVARLGGEEFVMLLEGATAQATCLHAERIRLGAATASPPGRPSPTVSVGVAEHRNGETLADLLRRADTALYHAKREGRDRVCLAPEPEPDPDAGNILLIDPQGSRPPPAGWGRQAGGAS